MSSSCTPILVGVVSLVSEIFLLSKMAKFPFRTMDYSPWVSKNLINWNRLKKFIQVRIDVTCIHTNFDGCDLFSFGDTATLKNGQISLSTHGLSIRIASKNACKLGLMSHAYTPILVGVSSPFSEIPLPQKWPIFPFDPWTIVHGHQKI